MQIGKNLRLHPVTGVVGYFPDRETKPWAGPIMSMVSDVIADAPPGSGVPSGYGARLEIAISHPGTMAAFLPWRSE